MPAVCHALDKALNLKGASLSSVEIKADNTSQRIPFKTNYEYFSLGFCCQTQWFIEVEAEIN